MSELSFKNSNENGTHSVNVIFLYPLLAESVIYLNKRARFSSCF